eukprot:1824492-Rhodomonas_salina.4
MAQSNGHQPWSTTFESKGSADNFESRADAASRVDEPSNTEAEFGTNTKSLRVAVPPRPEGINSPRQDVSPLRERGFIPRSLSFSKMHTSSTMLLEPNEAEEPNEKKQNVDEKSSSMRTSQHLVGPSGYSGYSPSDAAAFKGNPTPHHGGQGMLLRHRYLSQLVVPAGAPASDCGLSEGRLFSPANDSSPQPPSDPCSLAGFARGTARSFGRWRLAVLSAGHHGRVQDTMERTSRCRQLFSPFLRSRRPLTAQSPAKPRVVSCVRFGSVLHGVKPASLSWGAQVMSKLLLPPWERVLWKKQPYEDNYVDKTFLESLVTNANFHEYDMWQITKDSVVVSQ